MNSAAHRAFRKRCINDGVCWRCPKADRRPIAPDATLCGDHVAEGAARAAERAAHRRRDKSLCMDCPKGRKKPSVASWRCREHADKEAARRRAKRDAHGRKYVVFGEALTITELASISGVAAILLNFRMHRGLSAEQAAFGVKVVAGQP